MDINFALNDKEAAFIISALAEHPIKVCGELQDRLKKSFASQMLAATMPPAPPAPVAEPAAPAAAPVAE